MKESLKAAIAVAILAYIDQEREMPPSSDTGGEKA